MSGEAPHVVVGTLTLARITLWSQLHKRTNRVSNIALNHQLTIKWDSLKLACASRQNDNYLLAAVACHVLSVRSLPSEAGWTAVPYGWALDSQSWLAELWIASPDWLGSGSPALIGFNHISKIAKSTAWCLAAARMPLVGDEMCMTVSNVYLWLMV